MSSIIEEMAADRAANVAVNEEGLKKISQLANEQLELEAAVIKAQAEVDRLSARVRHISETELPEAFDQAGVRGFTLPNGMKIEVKPFYSASIPKDRKPEAFEWLKDRGHGDLIKTDVKVVFGKGSIEEAMELSNKLKEMGFTAEVDQGVHYQTLRAFVREQTENGVSIPSDLFGVFIGRKATIK